MNYCGRCRHNYNNHGNGHAAGCPLMVKNPALIESVKAKITAEKAYAEPELIFIRNSKFAGHCRSKDCRNSWDEGEAMYWSPSTHQVFCEECGDELNG